MAGVSGNNLAKGMLSGMIGLVLSTIGLDPMMAVARYTFGASEFLDGIAFVPVMIGLFGLGEVLHQMATPASETAVRLAGRLGRILPSRDEIKKMTIPGIIGSGVGTIVGAIPAAGGDIPPQ